MRARSGALSSREIAPCEGALSFFYWRPFASELAWVVLDMGMREMMEWGLEG